MWTGRRGLSEMLLEETQVSSLMSESLWPSTAFAQGAWMPLPHCRLALRLRLGAKRDCCWHSLGIMNPDKAVPPPSI